ncbi:MAG: DUF6263 family protein [Bacteroidota bacterium]
MKKITLFVTAVTALAAVISFEACQSSKASTASKMLKFNLENGKGYDYEMTVNMDQEIMGQPMKMDMTVYYSMDVSEDNGTVKTINASYERFKMNTAVGGMNIDIDTDKPITGDTSDMKTNPLLAVNKVFGAIKGQKFTMKVNAEGKITDVTGFENMGKNIAESLGLGEEEKAEMMKQFDGQFNADEIKQNLERFWYIFPNKEVKVGDTWDKMTEVRGKMPAKYKSSYKVTEIEGDMVTLEETSKIEAKENEMIGLTGDVTGTIVVDSRSGLVVTADQDMDMKASAQGMSFDIKGKSRIKGKAR